MKKLTTKIFAFIIAVGISAALPQLTFAQSKKRCPKGYTLWCSTDPWSGGRRCVCVPFNSSANGNINDTPGIGTHSVSNSNGIALAFQLTDAQNVSLKIYDGIGRLVKTVDNNRMPQGEYEIEWNTKDENGNLVPTGNYVLLFTTGSVARTKRFSVIR